MKIFVLRTCVIIFLFVVNAYASPAEEDAREISETVFSPFCSGRMLSDCPSEKSSRLLDSIEERLQNGESKSDIIEDLKLRYGDEIVAIPSFEGAGIIAWLMPLVFLLLGAGILLVWLKKSKDRNREDEELR